MFPFFLFLVLSSSHSRFIFFHPHHPHSLPFFLPVSLALPLRFSHITFSLLACLPSSWLSYPFYLSLSQFISGPLLPTLLSLTHHRFSLCSFWTLVFSPLLPAHPSVSLSFLYPLPTIPILWISVTISPCSPTFLISPSLFVFPFPHLQLLFFLSLPHL